ncbi:MAG: hypothetical protein AB1761_17750 [Pseudomonadota bacterium]
MPKAVKGGPSPNPAGRPKGIVDRRTKYRELIEPHVPELTAKALAMALAGDTHMMRLLLDKVIPTPKVTDSPIDLGAPLVGSATEMGAVVLAAVSAGRITPDQADSIMRAIANLSRVIEVDELLRRVEALETSANARTIDAPTPALPPAGAQAARAQARAVAGRQSAVTPQSHQPKAAARLNRGPATGRQP